ncbi:sigma-70 family RNA polymerase sigma factor [Paenibacillus sp. T1]|uniref:Sigma-70 family RNA polymerase sigma factor n=1 Tax=Paenibacillus glycinis TaxID=2697035 RepID=A0ABW9XU06_9BACL|nr:sigma-70 family RNA polymerase sigma factor [Paenibacillus glycinis]
MNNWGRLLVNGDLGPIDEAGREESLKFDLVEDKLLQLYNEMISVALVKVFNKSDAQDAVQEAWVRILTNHHSLREQDKLHAWAKVITANIANDFNKQAKRVLPAGDLGAETRRFRDEYEIMLEINELLDALHPKARALLLYKFYYGYRDQEIAAALHVPVGTIKARLHRTKRRLKQWMFN